VAEVGDRIELIGNALEKTMQSGWYQGTSQATPRWTSGGLEQLRGRQLMKWPDNQNQGLKKVLGLWHGGLEGQLNPQHVLALRGVPPSKKVPPSQACH